MPRHAWRPGKMSNPLSKDALSVRHHSLFLAGGGVWIAAPVRTRDRPRRQLVRVACCGAPRSIGTHERVVPSYTAQITYEYKARLPRPQLS